MKSASQGIRSISDQLQQVETLAKRFLDVRLFAGWAQEGIKLADTYAGLSGRLRQVVGESGNLAQAQQRLFAIAQSTQTPLEQTVGLYVRSNEALKAFNNAQGLSAKLAETVGLSFKAQASGASDVESTITQLTQAISTNTVQWEDFGQLADTNLMLVNTAAKNLGYDGLGSLKQAMADGKVSNIQLVNAIVAGHDQIKAAADKMPVTVGAAWTMVNNALIKYVGESDKARLSTSLLSGLLQGLANNVGVVADVATVLATLLLGRMAQGWLQSAQAAREAAIAAREKAAADALAQQAAQRALATEAQVAAMRVKTVVAAVEEARLYAAIVAGTDKETAAKKALAAAINQLHAAQAKQQAMNGQLAAGLEIANQKTGLLAGGFRLLGTAINGLMAIPLVTVVADWALKMDWFHAAAMRVQEGLVIVATGLKAFMDGASAGERWEQVKAIHAEFNQLIANNSASAKQAAVDVKTAEDEKAKATEQAAQAQQAAFAKVQEATKALTAQIDYGAKAQTAAIQQALAEKLAAIEAADINDAAKTAQRAQARMDAAQQELQLQQQAAQAKLALIDQEYQAELERAAANAERVKAIETDKKQAKLSVYQGLAEYYGGEIQRLTELYGQETKAFADSKQSLEQLAMDHEQKLLDIDRGGMTTRQKLNSEQFEFDKSMREVKAELAKGQAADQDKINALLKRSGELSQDIFNTEKGNAQSRGEQMRAQEGYKQRETQIYADRRQLIEADANAHKTAADSIAQGLETAKSKLEDANRVIGEMTANLSKEYLLKMGIDSASLGAAQAAIAELVKPETKIITIQTVNAGGGEPAQASGGLAGQPTGRPWRFNTGGWANRSGKLPGYGGGDKIRALLEAGEFIIRKEAVQKLGVPVLQLINQGVMPGQPIKRAAGGLVDSEVEKMMLSDGIEQLKKLLKAHYYDNMNQYFMGNRFNNASDKVTGLVRDLGARLKMPGYVMAQAFDATQRLPKAYSEREYGSKAREMAKREDFAFTAALNLIGNKPQESMPAAKIELPKPTLPKFSLPKLDTSKLQLPKLDTSALKLPNLQIPTPTIPKLEMPTTAAPMAAGAGRAVSVEFKLPSGAPVTGQFADGDVDRLLKVLKDASGYSLMGVR